MSGIKHRPLDYSQVVGSQAPVQLLKAFRASGVINNAYLFSGGPGTGKTTLARIFAKALLCHTPTDGAPCGKCRSCLAMDNGSHPSYTEVDAASKGGKGDVKALIESTQYESMDGSRSIIVMDEAHRISPDGKDALLKTLEEIGGSDRVVFIFCTNERGKMPEALIQRSFEVTIPSPSVQEVISKLTRICDADSIPYQQDGIEILAESFPGTYRTAENMLPVLKVLGGVTVEQVSTIVSVNVLEVAQCLAELPISLEKALTRMDKIVVRSSPGAVANAALRVSLDARRAQMGAGRSYAGAYQDAVTTLALRAGTGVSWMIEAFSSVPVHEDLCFLQASLVSIHHRFLKEGSKSDIPENRAAEKPQDSASQKDSSQTNEDKPYWSRSRARPDNAVSNNGSQQPATPMRPVAESSRFGGFASLGEGIDLGGQD